MTRLEKAYILPFAAFMLLLGLRGGIDHVCEGVGPFWLAQPMYWIFPLQTVVCGALLIRYRREYAFQPVARFAFTTGVAVLVLAVWIAPQEIFGAPLRRDGFNPELFAENRPLYALVVLLRFVRLVVVVPFLEEIFWRGYLLRQVVQPHFEKVPFGTLKWEPDRTPAWAAALGAGLGPRLKPLLLWGPTTIVALLFMLAHQPADYPAAFFCSLAYNYLAFRTRSLASCILAHAVTNLLLGLYILKTGQWGFW
jgi:uncharacterized protein